MVQHRIRAAIGLLVIGILAIGGPAFAAGSAGAVERRQVQGVTDDEIEVVAIVADLDGLRNRGINLPPKLTTGNATKRWQAVLDDFGAINGRRIRLETVVYDPTDPTSYDKACTSATQDHDPFVVVNTSGFRDSSLPCITVDNQTPVFIGDPVSSAVVEASGNRLFTLLPPGNVAATTTADLVADRKLIPKRDPVCILSSNVTGIQSAGNALEARLQARGYEVAKKIEINGLASDVAANNREAAAAVPTFEAAGCKVVFIGAQPATTQGYYQELQRSGAPLESYVIDDAASMCTAFAASRLPIEIAGTPCVTAADTRALPTKDGVKGDTAAEATCRALNDKTFGETSKPGVPQGDVTASGVTYIQDTDMSYCQIADLLLPAMKKAGTNLTWDKVARNLERTTSAPALYMSDGQGGFGKNKRYFAQNMHLVTLNPANAQTTVDANGLFGGCPAPTNCFVPQIIDGKEWFPISTKG